MSYCLHIQLLHLQFPVYMCVRDCVSVCMHIHVYTDPYHTAFISSYYIVTHPYMCVLSTCECVHAYICVCCQRVSVCMHTYVCVVNVWVCACIHMSIHINVILSSYPATKPSITCTPVRVWVCVWVCECVSVCMYVYVDIHPCHTAFISSYYIVNTLYMRVCVIVCVRAWCICPYTCVAVFCSVLQCVAVCCSVLQCVAVCAWCICLYTSMSYSLHI